MLKVFCKYCLIGIIGFALFISFQSDALALIGLPKPTEKGDKKNKDLPTGSYVEINPEILKRQNDFQKLITKFQDMQKNPEVMANLQNAQLPELNNYMSQLRTLNQLAMSLSDSTEPVDVIRVTIKKLIAQKLVIALKNNRDEGLTEVLKQQVIQALADLGINDDLSQLFGRIDSLEKDEEFRQRNLNEAEENLGKVIKEKRGLYDALINKIK